MPFFRWCLNSLCIMYLLQEPARPTSPAVDDALRAAESLLDSIKEGGGLPSMSSSNLGYTDFGYACDENGCVLVVQQDSTNATGGSCSPIVTENLRMQHGTQYRPCSRAVCEGWDSYGLTD